VKKLKLGFSLMQALHWCMNASFITFASAMFLAGGMSPVRIGTAISIMTGAGLLGQFLVGFAADAVKSSRVVYTLSGLLSIPACFGAYYEQDDWARIALLGVVGFLQMPLSAVLDTWILHSFAGEEENYGPIRAVGSGSFAVYSAFYGTLLTYFGYQIMPWVTAILILIISAIALYMPEKREMAQGVCQSKTHRHRFSGSLLMLLFRTPALLFLYLSLLLMGIGIGSIMTLMPIFLKSVGGDVSVQGIILLLACLCEIPFLLFSRKLLRFRDETLLIGAMLMGMIAMMGIGFSHEVLPLVLSCTMRGLSYGLALSGMRRAIIRYAPEHLQTVAQSIGDGLYICLGEMISGVLCAFLVEYAGIQTMAFVCVLAEVLAIAALISGQMIARQKAI